MIFKYTQIRRKINKFQAVEQNNVYKKQRHIYMQNFVYEYTTCNLSARNQGHYLQL